MVSSTWPELNSYSWPTQRSEIKWTSWVTNWITWIESLVINWSSNGITPINGLINWVCNGITPINGLMNLRYKGITPPKNGLLVNGFPLRWTNPSGSKNLFTLRFGDANFSTLWSWGASDCYLGIPEKWGAKEPQNPQKSQITSPENYHGTLKNDGFQVGNVFFQGLIFSWTMFKLQEFFWPKVSISTWTWRMSIPTISVGKGPISRCRPEETTEKKQNIWTAATVGFRWMTWICFLFGDFLMDSAIVNHHAKPPFGIIVLEHFLSIARAIPRWVDSVGQKCMNFFQRHIHLNHPV